MRFADLRDKDEGQTIDYKKQYNGKPYDYAKDICSFANSFFVSHIIIGIETSDESYGIPGKPVSIHPVGEEEYDRIRQSLYAIARNQLSPPITLDITRTEEGLVTVKITPSPDICQIIQGKSDRPTKYETWVRVGYNNKLIRTEYDLKILDRKKSMYKAYMVLDNISSKIEEGREFKIGELWLFMDIINQAVLEIFFISPKDYNRIEEKWRGLCFLCYIDRDLYKSNSQIIDAYPALEKFQQMNLPKKIMQFIDEYKSVIDTITPY